MIEKLFHSRIYFQDIILSKHVFIHFKMEVLDNRLEMFISACKFELNYQLNFRRKVNISHLTPSSTIFSLILDEKKINIEKCGISKSTPVRHLAPPLPPKEGFLSLFLSNLPKISVFLPISTFALCYNMIP